MKVPTDDMPCWVLKTRGRGKERIQAAARVSLLGVGMGRGSRSRRWVSGVGRPERARQRLERSS